jgi:acyl carrier protein
VPDPIDLVRTDVRDLLTKLGTGSPFADADDVFTARVVSSLNLLELIVFLEDTYRIEITQRDVFDGHLRSIDRMVELVAARSTLETP